MPSAVINNRYTFRLQLADGATDVFPAVTLYGPSGAFVATENLAHVAGGLYSGSHIFTVVGRYSAVFSVYSDAERSTLAEYDRTMEEIDVTALVPEAGVVQGIVPTSAASGLISMFRGDSHTVVVAATVDDEPVDLTGASVRMTVKKRSGGASVLSKTGTILSPAANGRVQFDFEPSDTTSIETGFYAYDVEVTLTGGAVYTVVKSTFELREDVSV